MCSGTAMTGTVQTSEMVGPCLLLTVESTDPGPARESPDWPPHPSHVFFFFYKQIADEGYLDIYISGQRSIQPLLNATVK